MSPRVHGIPTMYQGVRFRSRLEARWAAFFDHIGWRWDYEPIDLDGYIPDFVLRFHQPLLVEVKPEFELGALEQHAAKIERSGWKHEALIVGTGLHEHSPSQAALGLLGERVGNGVAWDAGLFHQCTNCKRPSIHHEIHTFRCRVSGCYEGDNFLGEITYEQAQLMWRRAANAAQWQTSWGVV